MCERYNHGTMNEQHAVFETMYQRASDTWSYLPCYEDIVGMFPKQGNGDFALDLGSGRGTTTTSLLNAGYRVIGIDYVQQVVDEVNQYLEREGYQQQARVVCGDVRELPFSSQSFNLVTDIRTLQHLSEEEWRDYLAEVFRVLQPGGYYLNVSLSRETKRFHEHTPQEASFGRYLKFGIHYYFFKDEELISLCPPGTEVIEQKHYTYPSVSNPDDNVVLLFSLIKKSDSM